MMRYLFSIVFLCLFSAVSSQSVEENILKANNHNNIKCAFIQEKHIALLDKVEKFDGVLYLKNDDKFSMHYSSSSHYLSINDNRFYMRVGKKVIKANLSNNEMFKQLSLLLINSVKGRLDEIQKNTNSVKTVKSTDSYYIVTFTQEKKQLKGYKVVELKYSKSKKQLVEMKLEEHSGNYNVYKLSNYEYPSSLSDSFFGID